MYSYCGRFAGIELNFLFRHADTAGHYGRDLKACPAGRAGDGDNVVTVPEKDVTDWMSQWGITDYSYGEYVISCNYACDVLMDHDRLVFHGAAFLWNGGGYIFTAPSGTGKTTQLRHWKKLYPEEMEILNGDKPILEVTAKDTVIHPSPWKGKENYGRDDLAAPLRGIVLLGQAKENRLRKMTPGDAVKKLFGRIYSTFNTEEEVRKAGRLLEQMLTLGVPIWYLENVGDEASARLTHGALCKERDDR